MIKHVVIGAINTANPPPPDDDSDEDDASDSDDDCDRLKGLAGVRGEAKVVMLSDSILEAIELERSGGSGRKGSTEKSKPIEMDDDEAKLLD